MKTKLAKLKEKAVKIVTAKMLEKHPKCFFCPNMANTAHHIIPQSRSNYLRCDERCLVSICQKCHMRLHSGYESVMTMQLVEARGKEWMDGLIKDSNVKIKDSIGYWTALIEEL